MSEEEAAVSQGAKLLANLGTNPLMMDAGEIDDIKFAVLDPKDQMFVIAADLMGMKDPYMRRIKNTFLKTTVGFGGRGRRDAIRGASVDKGAAASIGEEIQKPGWLERNITNRDWEEKEKKRMGLDEP